MLGDLVILVLNIHINLLFLCQPDDCLLKCIVLVIIVECDCSWSVPSVCFCVWCVVFVCCGILYVHNIS